MFRKPAAQTGVEKSTIAAKNIYPFGTEIALHIYLDEKDVLSNFSVDKLFWLKEGIEYGDWTGGPSGDGTFTVEKDIPITDHLKKNGSLYVHAFITRIGESPNPRADKYAKNHMLYMKKQLNK